MCVIFSAHLSFQTASHEYGCQWKLQTAVVVNCQYVTLRSTRYHLQPLGMLFYYSLTTSTTDNSGSIYTNTGWPPAQLKKNLQKQNQLLFHV